MHSSKPAWLAGVNNDALERSCWGRFMTERDRGSIGREGCA